MTPFGWISEPARRGVFLTLSALLIALAIALTSIGAPLNTDAAPRGIVSFELAGSAASAERMLASWSAPARERAMLSLGLDYLYMLVYPAWFSLACVLIARGSTAWHGRLGRGLAWLVLPTGVLDAVENWALIRILLDGASDGWAALAFWCAAPKFVLLLLAVPYVVVGGLVRLASAVLRRQATA